jgi:D-alanine-D-alanine ligase
MVKSNTMVHPLIILYGGPSSEREVSFGTKDFFYDLYEELAPIPVEWSEDHTFIYNGRALCESEFLEKLCTQKSIVLLASHGEYIEDGYIQGKFERIGIRFTGSNSISCKLAMNKENTQQAVKGIVQTIPTYSSFKKCKFPFVAKPNSLGSSVGVYVIENKEQLEERLPFFDQDYIFQPYIKGRELSLGSVRSEEGFLKLYPTEIITNNTFFDYEAKYVPGMSIETTPAEISPKLTTEIQNITNKIHDKLGLGYYSRSDFILTEDNRLYFLDTNALPGMTKTSLVPQQLIYSNLLDEFKKGLLLHLF